MFLSSVVMAPFRSDVCNWCLLCLYYPCKKYINSIVFFSPNNQLFFCLLYRFSLLSFTGLSLSFANFLCLLWILKLKPVCLNCCNWSCVLWTVSLKNVPWIYFVFLSFFYVIWTAEWSRERERDLIHCFTPWMVAEASPRTSMLVSPWGLEAQTLGCLPLLSLAHQHGAGLAAEQPGLEPASK